VNGTCIDNGLGLGKIVYKSLTKPLTFHQSSSFAKLKVENSSSQWPGLRGKGHGDTSANTLADKPGDSLAYPQPAFVEVKFELSAVGSPLLIGDVHRYGYCHGASAEADISNLEEGQSRNPEQGIRGDGDQGSVWRPTKSNCAAGRTYMPSPHRMPTPLNAKSSVTL